MKNYFNRNWLYKFILKNIIKFSTKLFSVSKFIAIEISKAVYDKEFIVIPNTVNEKYFNSVPVQRNNIFRFIHVSNMTENKNVNGILDAFRKLILINKDIILVIIGGDEQKYNSIKNEFHDIIQNIVLIGVLPYEEVAKELKLSDCCILNSDIENSPCIIVESLCCGVPVITTNVGGVPELVNQENSILINARNEEDLFQAMKAMVETKCNFNRKNISEDAINEFGYSAIGRKISNEYLNILYKY